MSETRENVAGIGAVRTRLSAHPANMAQSTGNGLFPEKHGKVSRGRNNFEVVQDVRSVAAVICRVIDDVKQDVSAGHATMTAANELKLNDSA
jgi:hypothetical protein